ncbi:MAG: hypothetical protein QM743_08830 [Chitinophagaceae bacterium]
MKIGLMPSYNDLFDGPPPSLEDVLHNIPSCVIIAKLAMINALLNINKSTDEIQIRIFNVLLNRQEPNIRSKILSRVVKTILKGGKRETSFFSQHLSLHFIHYIFINYREGAFEDLTQEQDLNFLKGYFVITNEIEEVYKNSFDLNLPKEGEFFYKATWPTFLEQFAFNQPTNPLSGMIRGLVFLDYLNASTDYSEYLEKFVRYNKIKNYRDYIFLLVEGIKKSFSWFDLEGQRVVGFLLRASDQSKIFFDNLSISHKEYKEQFCNSKGHYSGLKEKPLLKVGTESYIVIEWGFFYNKLYEGLLYDFHKYSGLSNHPAYRRLSDIKKVIAKEVTENFLFKKIGTMHFRTKAFEIDKD